MAANMDGVGELGVAEKMSEFDMITCLTKQHDIKKLNQYKKIKAIYKNIALSVGIKKEDFNMLDKLLKEFNFIKFICIDVANGYSERFSKFIKSVREKYPTKTIIAGNVVTADMTQELILSGADIVKVGIGPGSVCTTRKVAGVGYPQLSAIAECADAAHGLLGHVMADGGCSSPGDVAKAFAAGADFVMLGGMFAGHDESGGELIENGDGRMYKSFYGMSSAKAMESHYGEVAKHRAPEGKEVRVPYRGALETTVQSVLGGLRSACSYVGARRIKDLPKCATFIRVSQTTNEIYQRFDVEE